MTAHDHHSRIYTIVRAALRRETLTQRDMGRQLVDGQWLDPSAARRVRKSRLLAGGSRVVEALLVFAGLALVGLAFFVLTDFLI
ncbi:hypothetical protein ACEWPM_004205 [Roseovarius sp. S4756]|uniref:hypothetical protein n=1 Tax=Roseovarius maritimus TaxID=3342637 RepID=UPI00372999E9